jgi:hypothetical protein
MRRYRQTLDELLGKLSPLESTWKDAMATRVIDMLAAMEADQGYCIGAVKQLILQGQPPSSLDREHFETCLALFRLFLDVSKDEFTYQYRELAGESITVSKFKQNPTPCLDVL